MRLYQQLLTENNCYRTGRTIVPKGVMVHSTGANNPNLRRYVAPDDGRLGSPSSANWNTAQPDGRSVCVHGFIGRLADGTVASYQTLPWTCRGWHCGSGDRGSGNNTHIGFEICEDDLEDPEYFAAVYREAVELTAYLCKTFGLDPLADGVVICHSEGHQRGIASNHADVMHWFPRHGKDMDDFRRDVAAELKGGEEDVTQEQFDAMMEVYLRERGSLPPSDWSRDAREWAEAEGLIHGDENGDKQYQNFVTREQMCTFLKRFADQ